jgi:replicative superfamily II helicase
LFAFIDCVNSPFLDNIADAEEAEGNKLNLRGYQSELSQFANEGINTVICAPTGSGKTIVAIDIIQKHLDRRNILVDCTIEVC